MSEWYQQHLTAPDVYEATIRIGVIPDADHVQVLAELKDPTTGVLLAQASWPHGTMHDVARLSELARRRVVAWLDERTEPF